MKRLYKTGIFVLCTAFIIFCGTKVVQGAEEADTAEQIQAEEQSGAPSYPYIAVKIQYAR